MDHDERLDNLDDDAAVAHDADLSHADGHDHESASFAAPEGVAATAAADDATESLRDLVAYIIHNLVDDPEQAEITAERRGSSVHIQLHLPEDDLGKVIGRGGRIAKAIRTVLLVAGSRHHLRVSLDIESQVA
jgi:hypothetical protein